MSIEAGRTQGARAGVAGKGLGDSQADIDASELTIDDDDIGADSVSGATVLHAALAKLYALKTFVIAGADNSVTHDYTASGLVSTSKVAAALAFKDQAATVAAVAGTITPGTDKITVAGGDDLSASFVLVFFVFP
jgi:hypothetical protein